jgi:DNA-binding CsgD family transcriptional regulator
MDSRRSRPDCAEDAMDLIGHIYEAVGDEGRWARLRERLAGAESTPEIAHHVELARRAHERHAQLARDVAALSRVYDQLAVGALVVDWNAGLQHGNMEGIRALNEGVGLRLDEGRVRSADPDADATLLASVAEVAGADRIPRTALVLVRRPGRAPLSLFIARAGGALLDLIDGHHPVLLLLADPERSPVAGPEALKAIFGFTPREAECAGLLMRGCSLEDTARALGVTRNTVRTFLAHMAEKTDSHSRPELLARLFAIPSFQTGA